MHMTTDALKKVFIEELKADPNETIAFIFEGKAIVRTDQTITVSTKSTLPAKGIESAQVVGQLRDYMHKQNLSETAVAKDLGVSKGSLTHWFNGRNYPGRAVLKRLKAYLAEKGVKI